VQPIDCLTQVPRPCYRTPSSDATSLSSRAKRCCWVMFWLPSRRWRDEVIGRAADRPFPPKNWSFSLATDRQEKARSRFLISSCFLLSSFRAVSGGAPIGVKCSATAGTCIAGIAACAGASAWCIRHRVPSSGKSKLCSTQRTTTPTKPSAVPAIGSAGPTPRNPRLKGGESASQTGAAIPALK
jgi:hypothetical protein